MHNNPHPKGRSKDAHPGNYRRVELLHITHAELGLLKLGFPFEMVASAFTHGREEFSEKHKVP